MLYTRRGGPPLIIAKDRQLTARRTRKRGKEKSRLKSVRLKKVSISAVGERETTCMSRGRGEEERGEEYFPVNGKRTCRATG